MALPSTADEPRDPTKTLLYRIVRDHFETFRTHAATLRDGEGLPRFVEQEFRDFLRCGCLAGGFARFRCTACGLDRLVVFSYKGRGFCPRCGGRRMAERSAHLIDHVNKSKIAKKYRVTPPGNGVMVGEDASPTCRCVNGS